MWIAGSMTKPSAPVRPAPRSIGREVAGMPVATVGVIASFEGHEYLVSRLGQGSQWVRNVRVTDGLAMIRAGERHSVALREVAVERRAPRAARRS
jgi:hypothetical protein